MTAADGAANEARPRLNRFHEITSPALRRGVVTALVAVLLLSGCGSTDSSGGPNNQGPPSGGTSKDAASSGTTSTPSVPVVEEVAADAKTQPSQHAGDSMDDPAIWVDRRDPARSLVIGNDKQGALLTYGLDGKLVQRITSATSFWGNVDVRQDVPLASGPTDVVAVANAGLRLYTIDPGTRQLSPITRDGNSLDTGGGEGLCLYDNADGKLSVFMVNISGATRQFALKDDGTGQLSLEQVRSFKVGSEAEGCVVDDETRSLYISEENVGLWKYGAEPSSGEDRMMVDEVKPKGHQTADIEGVTLVDDGNGAGLIITSSQGPTQGPSHFSAFDRSSGDYLTSFRIVDGPTSDGCSHTDGVAATAEPLGPQFPHGLFVCQDDDNTAPGDAGNQDFKLTRLEKVRP
jgi:3-phytase